MMVGNFLAVTVIYSITLDDEYDDDDDQAVDRLRCRECIVF